LKFFRVAPIEHNTRTCLRERSCYRETYATGGARNKRPASVEPKRLKNIIH
jgi:hypothetical protein